MVYRSRMSRPSNHSTSVVERAKAAADSATTLQELRLAQAILLPAVLGATIGQTAELLGVGHATVSRLQAAFRTSGGAQASATKSNWGGSAPLLDDAGRGKRVPRSLDASRGQWDAGSRFAHSRRLGPTSRTNRESLGRLSDVGSSRLAQGRSRHAAS